MFEKLWEGNQLALKNVLDAGPSNNVSKTMKKVFTYYSACLDGNGTLEEHEGKPLLDILNSPGIGGWKILKEEVEKEDDGAAAGSTPDRKDFQKKLMFQQLEYQASGLFSWMVRVNLWPRGIPKSNE